MTWLRGKNDAVAESVQYKSVEEGLLAYFKLLQNINPLQKHNLDFEGALTSALDFVTSCDWTNKEVKANIIEKIKTCLQGLSLNGFWSVCCAARKFIYENLAKETKVVGHIVDGIHCLTALEYGYLSPDACKCKCARWL